MAIHKLFMPNLPLLLWYPSSKSLYRNALSLFTPIWKYKINNNLPQNHLMLLRREPKSETKKKHEKLESRMWINLLHWHTLPRYLQVTKEFSLENKHTLTVRSSRDKYDLCKIFQQFINKFSILNVISKLIALSGKEWFSYCSIITSSEAEVL